MDKLTDRQANITGNFQKLLGEIDYDKVLRIRTRAYLKS